MTTIICDTMIWYGLGAGIINSPDLEKYSLVCTGINLEELAFSGNNINKLEEVRNAIHYIIDNKVNIIPQSPLEHVRGLFDQFYGDDYNPSEDPAMWFLKTIYSSTKPQLEQGSLLDALKSIIERRRLNLDDRKNFRNEIKEIEKDLKPFFKRHYSYKSRSDLIRKEFLFEFNDRFFDHEPVEIDWTLLNFYEKMCVGYDRLLSISNQRADKNDYNDLRNMLYVQPGMKYWTLEKTWLQIGKQQKMQEYLFFESSSKDI